MVEEYEMGKQPAGQEVTVFLGLPRMAVVGERDSEVGWDVEETTTCAPLARYIFAC
jgi:hypothetical protein